MRKHQQPLCEEETTRSYGNKDKQMNCEQLQHKENLKRQVNVNKKTNHKDVERKERNKSMNTIASKMKMVVEKMIENGKSGNLQHEMTIFIYKSHESEILYTFLQEMRKENPEMFRNKRKFLETISEKYDEIIASLNEKFSCCTSHKTLYYSRYLVSK